MSLLHAAGVSVSFGGVHAVDDVSVTVAKAETVGLVGPNGSGKSTLLDVLSGFRAPNHGSVVFRGRDVTRRGPEERVRLGLARTFQSVSVFEGLTVAEHLDVVTAGGGRNGYRTPVEFATICARLLDATGLGRQKTESVASLTAAECRVLDIARAVLQAPDVLFMDEPFAGLDRAQSVAVSECVRACVALGTAVLVVEHRLRQLRELAGRLLVLHGGRLIADGEPAAILASDAVMSAYRGDSQGAAAS